MKILSVSELTQEIKTQLENNWREVTVKGEISNLKLQSSGHIYFTLKDAGAQIASVLFKGALRGVARAPKEGEQVIAKGEITVYPPRGSYQLLVRSLDFQGIGELLLRLHERRLKLQAEGLFATERKKKLPPFPKTIGVITSPTGAVIQDILHVLSRRHAGFHLILYPVKVQGEGAKEEIAKAIEEANRYQIADVLILARGGGSLEDLWAFNEEIVVRAIANSKIPLVSAVGHETDVSLADLAADVRAPTPSAAAEIVLKEKKEQLAFLTQTGQRAQELLLHLLKRLRKQLSLAEKNPYLASPYLLLARRLQDLDEAKNHLQTSFNTFLNKKKLHLIALEKQKQTLNPSYRVRVQREKLLTLQKSLTHTILRILGNKKALFQKNLLQQRLHKPFLLLIQQKKEKLHTLTAHLTSLDPNNLLAKGYCILFSENRDSVILSTREIDPSRRYTLLMKDGQVAVTTEEITYADPRQPKL